MFANSRIRLWKLPCKLVHRRITNRWTNPVRLSFVPVLHTSHVTSQGIGFWVLRLWRCHSNHARRCLPGRTGRLIQIPRICWCSCKLVQVRQRTLRTRSSEWRCSRSCWMWQNHFLGDGYICQHQLSLTIQFSFEIPSIAIITQRRYCLCLGTFWCRRS